MIRKIVACPSCALHFLSARPRTYCPGCHQLVEPVATGT
jgi:Zn finger protein HypA/HybF involved in hydrogenase expression